MLTRKGHLRCDACGKKQPKRGDFLLVACWSLGKDARFEPVEPMDTDVADHFCSWRCLAHHAISEAIDDVTVADIGCD